MKKYFENLYNLQIVQKVTLCSIKSPIEMDFLVAKGIINSHV